MKKLFFTALVAVVAIGGAFAGNASSKLVFQGAPFNSSGPCQFQSTIQNCTETVLAAPCQLNNGSPAYTTDASGTCTKPLYRIN